MISRFNRERERCRASEKDRTSEKEEKKIIEIATAGNQKPWTRSVRRETSKFCRIFVCHPENRFDTQTMCPPSDQNLIIVVDSSARMLSYRT